MPRQTTLMLGCVVLAGSLLSSLLTADEKNGKSTAAPATAQNPAAQNPAAKSAAAPAATPTTHQVTQGPFRVEVELDGVFEAEQSSEIVLRPELWADLSVLKAVAHGTRVKAGDELVTLDTKTIDEAIRDAQTAQEIAALTGKHAEESVRLLEKSTPLDLAAAEQAHQQAGEDFKRFTETDRQVAEKNAHLALEQGRNYLEYNLEELRQLEKMYAADDLTEETEEIILKRARIDAEQAKQQFENAKLNHDRTLKITIPRQQESLERGAAQAALAWERARTTLPIALGQKRLELAKMQHDLSEGKEKLAKLNKDRAGMNINAPIAGIVYYGRSTRGVWSGGPEAAQKLRLGGKILLGEVFMTVVRPEALQVRVTIAEKELRHVRFGGTASVLPHAFPDRTIAAKVGNVASVPLVAASFDGLIDVNLGNDNSSIVPGMTCNVKIIAYQKESAVAVPSEAVRTDEQDATKRYVKVVKNGGEIEQRVVKVGETAGGKTEILDGLKAGETINLEKAGA